MNRKKFLFGQKIPHSALIVDGGGTKTQFILKKGQQVLRESTRPSHFPSLKKQIRQFLSDSGRPGTLVLGLRGVWTPGQKKKWATSLKDWADKITILSDVELAYQLSFGNKSGVVLVAGTGSIAYGQNKKKQWARAGGIGPREGDQGSGYWIGKNLKNKYLPKNINNLQKISNKAFLALKTSQGRPDKSQRKIFLAAQEELIELVRQVVQQLRWRGPVPLRLWGGLFKNRWFTQTFLKKLARRLPSARVVSGAKKIRA